MLRHVLGVSLVFFVALTSCVPAGVEHLAPSHQTYRYVPTTPAGDTHSAGEALELVWDPEAAGSVTDASAMDVELRAEVRGPFASVDELKRVMSAARPSAPLAEPVGDAANPCLRRTDTWSGSVVTCDMRYPASPGFYDLAMATSVGPRDHPQDVTTAHAVIRVVAP